MYWGLLCTELASSTGLHLFKPKYVGRERKSRKSMTIRISRESESAAAGTGRPDRSTGVHQRAQAGAVDRLTLRNSRLGTVDRVGRPGAWVGRPTGESGLI